MLDNRELQLIKFQDFSFYIRKGSSDIKAIKEVIEQECYKNSFFKINPNENWLDIGANVGAFSVYALNKKANVVSFEPDPDNFILLNKNVQVNKFNPKNFSLIKAGLTYNEQKKAYLYKHPKKDFWRNSLIEHFKDKQEKVVVNLEHYLNYFSKPDICIKMDIEGFEVPILKDLLTKNPKNFKIKKMVFEYSFDIFPSLIDYFQLCHDLKRFFKLVHFRQNPAMRKHDVWQPSWFPKASNVFCSNE